MYNTYYIGIGQDIDLVMKGRTSAGCAARMVASVHSEVCDRATTGVSSIGPDRIERGSSLLERGSSLLLTFNAYILTKGIIWDF